MSIETLKQNLKKDFSNNYKEIGDLVLLEFRAKHPKKNLLFVSSEHGDEISGSDILVKKARFLRNSLLPWTGVSIIPVVDVEGYPSSKTGLGYTGFGREKCLDSAYCMDSPPEVIKNLQNVLKNNKYGLVCMFNSRFKEEAPFLDGFFIEPQISSVKGVLDFGFEEASDLMGYIVYSLLQNNCKVLSRHKNGSLGDGYMFFRKGIVIPGREESSELVCETRLGLLKYCQENDIPALAFTSISSKVDNELKSASLKAHETAFKAVFEFYKKLR